MKVTHGKNTPVLVPIRGDATQTSGDVQRKTKTIQNTKTKTKPFYLLYMSRRLRRPLLEQTANQGAPSSCPGQK